MTELETKKAIADTTQLAAQSRLVQQVNLVIQNLKFKTQNFFSLPLYVLLLAVVVALVVAWQVPFSYQLNPNSDLHLDEPFVQNFNAVEQPQGVPSEQSFYYRWSKGEGRFYFPGIGKNSYHFKITLTADFNPQKNFQVFANQTPLGGNYSAQPGQITYEFDIPAEAIQGKNGDLTIYVKFQPFTPNGDPRQLGFAWLSAELAATGISAFVPPLLYLGYLVGAVMLIYLLVAIAGAGSWLAAGVAGVFGAVLAYIVATGGRPWLMIFTERLCFALVLSLIATALFAIFSRRMWQARWEQAWVLSIFGLALAIRFGGLIFPNMYSVDIGFHYNRFTEFWQRGDFFVKIVSNEWGGRETYYPPTTYMFAGLWRWLFDDTYTLLRFWLAFFDASRALLIFWLVRRVTGDGRAAVISAFLLVTMPVAVISLSFAQVAQMFGEWVALAILCIVVVRLEQLRRWYYFVALLGLLTAAFLQHPGVILLIGSTFLLLSVILFFDKRAGGKILLLIYGLALLISVAFYHRVTLAEMLPQAYQTLESKLSGKALPTDKGKDSRLKVGGSVNDNRLQLKQTPVDNLGDLLTGGFKGFWREAQVYYQVIPLLMLPWALLWLWRTSRPTAPPLDEFDTAKQQRARRRMAWASFAWLAVVILFALVGLFLNLYVRYSLFLLPIVAAGAGIFLSRQWRRTGWPGLLLTITVCAFMLISVLALYFDRVIFYR